MYASTYVSDCICHKCIYIQFNQGLDGRKPEADLLCLFVESLDLQGAFFKLFSTEDHEIWHTYWHRQAFPPSVELSFCVFLSIESIWIPMWSRREIIFKMLSYPSCNFYDKSLVFDYEICQYRLKWSILYLLLITWGITESLKVLYAKILCKMQVSIALNLVSWVITVW